MNEPKVYSVVREILKSDVRLNKVVEIRRKFIYKETKITPIATPISLLELMEWNAGSAFLEYVAETSGALYTRKMGKKELGNYLKKALELRKLEVKNKKQERFKETTGLEFLMSDTWLNRGFTECHGLSGLLQVDIKTLTSL